MAYTVTAYKGTGCNAINVPDSPDKFSTWATETLTLPAVNLITDWGLDGVYLQCNESQALGIDTIKIGDYYYSAGKPAPSSDDVFYFPLTYDGTSTHGGAEHLKYLDGITERHTTSDDTMFKYTQSDEYMTPRQQLMITEPVLLFGGSDTTYTLVESTIDLYTLGFEFSTDNDGNLKFNGTGITYTDESGNAVTVPYVFGIGGSPLKVVGTTSFKLGDKVKQSPNTSLFAVDGDSKAANTIINRALSAVRSLSLESAIISQTKYDKAYVDFSVEPDFTGDPNGWVSPITGKEETVSTNLPFERYTTAHNKRLEYGEYNKYGLITAAGEKGEFLPEQIRNPNGTDSAPTVSMKADPRPTGKPYFRFHYYLGDSSDNGFWINALGGLQWENVPLTYQGSSGSYLNRLNFENDAKMSQTNYNYDQKVAGVNTAQDLVNGVFDFMSAFSGGNSNEGLSLGGWLTGMGKSISDTAFGTARNIMDIGHRADTYKISREKELQNYGFSQTVVAPQVAFPFNANLFRDFIGNGVFVYRYYYSDSDVSRIDKLLTMYGYKDSVALSASLFHNRKNFDYVRANGVSIGGDMAMWEKQAIAEQLNAGIRVWHVKPDPTYYSQANPIL